MAGARRGQPEPGQPNEVPLTDRRARDPDPMRAPRLLRTFEREGPSDDSLHGGSRRVGGRSQADESRVLATALENSARIVQFSAAVEEERGVRGERAYARDVVAADRISRELPHRAFRTRWLA